MRCLALALLLTACSGPPAPQAHAAAPLPDAAPVGAMPIPGEATAEPSLDEGDTTVTRAELQAIVDLPRAARLDMRGEVMLALHADRDDMLRLSIVENESGIVAQFPLGPGNHLVSNHTFDGNTYPSRNFRGDYTGPILFAIRALPGPDSPEDQRRQLAVYSSGSSLLVATRWPGSPWSPVLQLHFPRGTTFTAIGSTDPH